MRPRRLGCLRRRLRRGLVELDWATSKDDATLGGLESGGAREACLGPLAC